MLRKTVTLNESLYESLEANHIIDKFHSFSEMVSVALQTLLKEKKNEAYKQAMMEASKDNQYLQDMNETDNDFAYADFELQK